MTDYDKFYFFFSDQVNHNLSFLWFIQFLRLYFKKSLIVILFNITAVVLFYLFINTFFSKIYVIFDQKALILFLLSIQTLNVDESFTLLLMSLNHYHPKELIRDFDEVESSYKRMRTSGHKPQVQYTIFFILVCIFLGVIPLWIFHYNIIYVSYMLPIIVLGMFPASIIPHLYDQDDFWIIYTNSVLDQYSK